MALANSVRSPVPALRLGGAGARRVHPINGSSPHVKIVPINDLGQMANEVIE